MGCVTSASVEPAGSPEAKTEARVPAQTIAKVLARKGANVVRMARSVDTLFNAFCTRPEVDPMATLTAVLLYLSAADRSLDLDGDEARSIKRIFDNHLGKLLRQASTCKEGRSATEGRPWAAGARETMLAGLRAAQAQCSSDDELEDFLRDLHAAYGRVLNVPCIPRAEALLREYVIDIGLNKWASKNLPFSDDDTAAYRNFSAEQIAAFDELDADHCGDEDFFLIQHRKVLGAFFEISESGGGDGKMDSIEDDDDENEATGAKTASEDSPSTPSEALPAKTIKDFKSVSEIGSLAQMGYTYDRWGTVPTEGFVKKLARAVRKATATQLFYNLYGVLSWRKSRKGGAAADAKDNAVSLEDVELSLSANSVSRVASAQAVLEFVRERCEAGGVSAVRQALRGAGRELELHPSAEDITALRGMLKAAAQVA